MTEIFHVNFSFSGQAVLQKILEIFSYINTCKTVSPIMASPDHPPPPTPIGDHGFYKLEFVLCYKAFMYISVFLAQWFFRRRLLKIYIFYINICKNSFPYCGPNRLPGAIILTNFNLRYVWKFLQKLQLSWSCGYLEFKNRLKVSPTVAPPDPVNKLDFVLCHKAFM
jgi:hypothetical protein